MFASCRARIDATRSARVRDAAATVRDWPAFVRAAQAHAIVPTVHRQLDAAAAAPADVRAQLGELSRAIAIRNVQLTRVLIETLRALESTGIPAMPVKGPALGATYGDLALRQFADLDLIVAPAQTATAMSVLERQGFVRSAPNLDAAQQAALFGGDYHHAFIHPGESVALELHWALERPHAGAFLDAAWCWERQAEVRLGNVPVQSLSAEANIVYLAIHGAKHCWAQLKWVTDFAELADSAREVGSIDWDAVLRDAERLRVRRMVSVGLRLSGNVTGLAVPSDVLAKLPRDAVVDALVGEARERLMRSQGLPSVGETGAIVRFQWRARDRFADRLKLAADILFSPQLSDVTTLKLPQPLTAAYYLLRPVRLAGKYVRLGTRRLLRLS